MLKALARRSGGLLCAAMAALVVLACSSSSGSSSPSVSCQTLTRSSEGNRICGCYPASSAQPSNDAACGTTSLDVACDFHAAATPSCECAAFLCSKSGDTVFCGYDLNITEESDGFVDPSACVGPDYCLDSDGVTCWCQNGPCAASQRSVASCTDDMAKTTLQQFVVGFGDTLVTDCRAAMSSATPQPTTTNKCQSGPGKCANGDSSTCACEESCVQTSTASGSTYECVKGCATDTDCAGYFSGDSPPAPLQCVPASSTMPVAHCGL
jgi:hypothetical protein